MNEEAMKKETIVNDRYPHRVKITRCADSVEGLNPFDRAESDGVVYVVYDGEGRSYTDTTTDGDAAVDTNKRKASIPMRFDKWGVMSLWPLDGDLIEVEMGAVRECGRVKDFEPDNNRSVICWELTRN